MIAAGLDWASACRKLGVSQSASLAEIKRQFRRLARKHHPDTFVSPADKDAATKRFQPLVEAYSYLLSTSRPRYEEKATSVPPSSRFGWSAAFGRPTETIQMWDLLEPLKERHPFIYFVLELFLIPSAINIVFTMWPLLLPATVWKRHPRLYHLASSICLRWAPVALTLFVGYAGVATGRMWGVIFLGSGIVSATLEGVAQLTAWQRWKHNRSSLATVLAEVQSLEDAV